MKKLIITSLIAAATINAWSAGTVDLQGTAFKVDTIRNYDIAGGLSHTHLRLSTGARTIDAYLLDYDKTLAVNVEPKVIVGRDSCNTAETVSSMARRHTDSENQILAGINGDFFITSSFASMHEFGNAILGYPNMSCFIDGKIVAPDIIDKTSRENALIIAKDNWWIDATDLKYRVLNNDGSTVVDATAVNYPRRDEEMVVYNSYAGRYTKTASGGREIVLKLAPGAKWAVNKSVKFNVVGDWSTSGNSAIPEDGIVISCGPKYSNDFIDNLKDGDIVKLKIVLSLPAHDGIKPTDISDVIGGDVRILKENVTTTEAIRWINTPSALYSRSLVGFDKDRRHMYLCVVDAGNGSSGVSYYEAADLMRFVGCWDALDLDGGGSTEMWTAHAGVVNHLRDGSERAVGNALYFRLKAPASSQVESIAFSDRAVTLPQYAIYKPTFYGYNPSGQLVDTDVKDVALVIPNGLGDQYLKPEWLSVTGHGAFMLGARSNDGKMTTSVPVTVDTSVSPSVATENLIVDNAAPVTIPMTSTLHDVTYTIQPAYYSWTADNPDIVDIDHESGALKARAEGTTLITGKAGDATVEFNAVCQPLNAEALPITGGAIDPDDWKISKASVKDIVMTPLGSHSGMSLDFNVTAVRGPRLTVTRLTTLYAIPEGLKLRLSADKPLKQVAINIKDASGTTYTFTTPLEDATYPYDINLDFADKINVDDPTVYPLSFNSMAITPTVLGTQKVDIDHIVALYTKRYELGIENVSASPASDLVITVTPDAITVPQDVDRLELYDAAGRLVSFALNTNSVRRPATPGLYFVRTITANAAASAKVAIR